MNLLRRRKKLFIFILLSLALLVSLPFAAYYALLYYLHPIAQERISALFKTQVTFKQIQIVEWKTWNQLTLSFKDIVLQGTPTDSVTRLAYVNHLSCTLPIVDIFLKNDSLLIPEIQLDSLHLDFYVDNHRNKNYKLFRAYDPNQKKTPAWVHFPNIFIRACHFHYYFKLPDRDYTFEIQNVKPTLTVLRHHVELSLQTHGYIPQLREGETTFMQNASLKLDYHATITKSKQKNTFKHCHVEVGGVPIEVFGDFLLGWERDYNLKLSVHEASYDSLIKLLPQKIQDNLKVYDVDGNLSLKGTMKGKWKPFLHIAFETDSVTIANTITAVTVSHLLLKGTFRGGGEHGKSFAKLQVDTLKGNLNNRPFWATFSVQDFERFWVEGRFFMQQQLPNITNWVGFEPDNSAKGDLEADVTVLGALKDIAAFDMSKISLKGFLKGKELQVPETWTPFSIHNLNFDLLFNDHVIQLANASVLLHQQPIQIHGWLSTKAFAIKPQFIGYININFLSLNINEFLTKNVSKNKRNFPSLPDNFFIDIDLNANAIAFKKIFLEHAHAKLSLRPHELHLHHAIIKGKTDSLILQANLFQKCKDTLYLESSQRLETQSLSDLLQEFGIQLPTAVDSLILPLKAFNHLKANLFLHPNQIFDGFIQDKIFVASMTYPAEPPIYLSNFQANLLIPIQNLFKPTQSHWLMDHIQGNINEQPIAASLQLVYDSTLKTFRFYPGISMELCVEALQPFLKPDNISNFQGNFFFDYFGHGLLKNFLRTDSLPYQASQGQIRMENLGFIFENRNLPVSNTKGKVIYDDNHTVIDSVCGEIAGSDFCLQAQSKEILAFLFLKNTLLKGHLKMFSETIFLKPLLLERYQETNKEDKPNKEIHLKIPSNLFADIEVSALSVIFDKLRLEYLLLDACVQDRVTFLDNFEAYFDKGYWDAFAIWDSRDTNHQHLYANVFLKNLDVSKFLHDFNNFQQSFIEHQNVEGDLSLQAEMEISFPAEVAKTDLNTLNARLSILLENGMLRNFVPFQKLKGIVRKKYLEAPHFTLMAPQVLIQNRTLYFPKVEIRSDIANIVFTGTHTFDQEIDYRIRILRVKRHQSDKKQQAVQYNKTIFLFRLHGKNGKYKLSYDMKALWQSVFKPKKLESPWWQ